MPVKTIVPDVPLTDIGAHEHVRLVTKDGTFVQRQPLL